MKLSHRILGCTLASLLALTALAACGGSVSDTSSDGSPVSQGDSASGGDSSGSPAVNPELDFSKDEEITITVMTNDYISEPISGDQLVLKELGKRTKVKINFQVVPSADYLSKLNTTIVSNRLPDFVNILSPDTVSKYLADGILVRLNDLLDKYGKSIKKKIAEIPGMEKNLKDDNGNIWYLPRIDTSGLNTMYIINKKFLDQCKLDVPTTIDEFYNCLKAFKALGNDIIPLGAGFATSLEMPIFNAFRTSYGDRWLYLDGKYVYTPYEHADRVKAALQFLNKCYSEGLIDREYYALSNDDAYAKMCSGKLGVFNCWQDGVPGWMEGNEDNPELSYVPLYPLSSEYGQGIAGRRSPLSGYYSISSKSKYADRIVRMVNYMLTDEGMELMNWGIKGQTYVVNDDGTKSYTDMIMKYDNNDPVNGRRHYGMDHVNFINCMDLDSWAQTVDDPLPEIMKNMQKYYLPDQPVLVLSAKEGDRFAQIMADVDKYVTTCYQQFIVGQLNFTSDWDNFQKQMKNMGVEEAIKIRKTAFDRWLKR